MLGRLAFRGRDAVAAGLLTPKQLRSASWRRVFTGIYVHTTTPDTPLLRIRAASLFLPPGAVITGRSAAVVWGAGLGDLGDPVEIASPTRMARVRGAVIRTERVAPGETTLHTGLPVHRIAHTAFAIARDRPRLEAVAWIDALLRRREMTSAQALAHARSHIGDRHWRTAVATLGLCDERAESPRESELRVHLVTAGIGPLVPQFEVRDAEGRFAGRVDLALPDCRVGIEYDGIWHATGAQLSRDRRRLRRLNAASWYIYHVTAADLHDIPTLVADLRRVIAARRSGLG